MTHDTLPDRAKNNEESSIPGRSQNISDIQRLFSLAAGAALVRRALRKRGSSLLLAGIPGALLLQRAATGYCKLYAALELDSGEPREQPGLHVDTSIAGDRPARGALRRAPI